MKKDIDSDIEAALNMLIANIESVGLRISAKHELISEMTKIIQSHCSSDEDIKSSGKLFFQQGENHYYGINGCFEDENKATEYFKQALTYGDHRAAYYLGSISDANGDKQSAIDYYMIGANACEYINYARLGRIYLIDTEYNNERNARIAWSNFFENLPVLIDQGFEYLIPQCFVDYILGSSMERISINEEYVVLGKPYKSEIWKSFNSIRPRLSDAITLRTAEFYLNLL